MYSRFQLQNECSSRTAFEQGIRLCRENRISKIKYASRKVDGAENACEIISTVEGDHGVYSVRLIVDEKNAEEGNGRLLLKYCSCPGSSNNGDFCKHCIGTLLRYFELREAGLPGKEQTDSPETETGSVGTHEAFLEMLKQHNARKKLELTLKNKRGTLRIVPHLTLSDVSADVEFRAGSDKLYIIRDISAFVKAVEENRAFRYGKNLEFVHSRELFDGPSRKLLDFMVRYETNKKTHTLSYAHRTDQEYRFITLRGETLDSFFDAAAGTEILTSTDMTRAGDQEKRSERYAVKRGMPVLRMTVKGLGDKGAVLSGDFPCVFAGMDNYIIIKEKTIYTVPKTELQDMELFLRFASEHDGSDVYLAAAELPLFAQEILQTLKRYYRIDFVDFDEDRYLPEQAEFKIYLDAPKKDIVTCALYAVYGDGQKKYNVYADRDYTDPDRDETAEMNAIMELKKYFSKYDPKKKVAVLACNENQLYDFINEGLYELEKLGEVYVSDRIKSIKVRPSPKVTAGVSLGGDLLTFSMQSSDLTGAQLAEILAKYDRRKKFFRLTDGTFIKINAESFESIVNISKTLHLTEEQLSSGTVVIPKFRALYLDAELKDSADVTASRSREFRALIRNMKTVEDNDFEVPPALKPTLRNYQRYGFRWLKTLRNNGFGGILADEMGLGKTLQIIAFLLSEAEEGRKERALIVCPASLVFNWKNEFERFAPSLKTVIVAGTLSERTALIGASEPGDILITSYDLLKRDIDSYENIRFGYQIVDEAQYIKNNATRSSRTVKSIRADFRVALTGTPIENRLSELWSIFDYLMPGFLHSYPQFREEFEIPIVQFRSREDMKRLQKMIGPFILRRLKSEVLKDLPEKLEEPLATCLAGEQLSLYNASVSRLREEIRSRSSAELSRGKLQILAELTRLRQLCCDPSLLYENYSGGSAKVELCMEVVRRALDGGHRILLFSQFTSMLDILQARLAKEHIPYYSLVGSTPKEKRIRMADAFNDGEVPVFCISLKAGGTGLNLTAADLVIHFDPWWNVAVQNQATDRAHRIGQKHAVTVYKLIAKGTIEENILKLQETKQELAEQLLGGDEFGSPSFTREELLALLGE